MSGLRGLSWSGQGAARSASDGGGGHAAWARAFLLECSRDFLYYSFRRRNIRWFCLTRVSDARKGNRLLCLARDEDASLLLFPIGWKLKEGNKLCSPGAAFAICPRSTSLILGRSSYHEEETLVAKKINFLSPPPAITPLSWVDVWDHLFSSFG